MMSAHLDYVVQPRENGWTVAFCQQAYGCYPKRIEALRSAASDASRVRRMGLDVAVHVERPPAAKDLPKRTLKGAVLTDKPRVVLAPPGR